MSDIQLTAAQAEALRLVVAEGVLRTGKATSAGPGTINGTAAAVLEAKGLVRLERRTTMWVEAKATVLGWKWVQDNGGSA